jgi:hypothetical protein
MSNNRLFLCTHEYGIFDGIIAAKYVKQHFQYNKNTAIMKKDIYNKFLFIDLAKKLKYKDFLENITSIDDLILIGKDCRDNIKNFFVESSNSNLFIFYEKFNIKSVIFELLKSLNNITVDIYFLDLGFPKSLKNEKWNIENMGNIILQASLEEPICKKLDLDIHSTPLKQLEILLIEFILNEKNVNNLTEDIYYEYLKNKIKIIKETYKNEIQVIKRNKIKNLINFKKDKKKLTWKDQCKLIALISQALYY